MSCYREDCTIKDNEQNMLCVCHGYFAISLLRDLVEKDVNRENLEITRVGKFETMQIKLLYNDP